MKYLQERYKVDYINLNGYYDNTSLWKRNFRIFVSNDYENRRYEYIITELNKYKNNIYDKIFIIKGEFLSQSHIDLMNNFWPNSERILYLWDSFINHTNKDVLSKNFKNIYSFDRVDCSELGFKFRPLFYTTLNTKNKTTINYKWDFSFVGSFSEHRLKELRLIKDFCKKYNLKYKFRLLEGKKKYYWNRIIGNYSSKDRDILTTKIISYDEYLDITSASKCIVDFPNEKQTGLTIRTLETLAYGKKIITTNKTLAEYSDIDKSSYYIKEKYQINDEDLLTFIKKENSNNVISSNYSLSSFLKDLTLL